MPNGDRLPMPFMYREVGKLVRAHRQKLGLSQAALATRVGHTRTSVTNIEAGRQRIPLDLLFTFASALEVSVTEFVPRLGGQLSPEVEKKILGQYDDSQIRAIRRVIKR